jgi:hypothetical protein
MDTNKILSPAKTPPLVFKPYTIQVTSINGSVTKNSVKNTLHSFPITISYGFRGMA